MTNLNRYYSELHLIDEFHANFIPNKESEARKIELYTLINKENNEHERK